jgi:hypothetical protein
VNRWREPTLLAQSGAIDSPSAFYKQPTVRTSKTKFEPACVALNTHYRSRTPSAAQWRRESYGHHRLSAARAPPLDPLPTADCRCHCARGHHSSPHAAPPPPQKVTPVSSPRRKQGKSTQLQLVTQRCHHHCEIYFRRVVASD